MTEDTPIHPRFVCRREGCEPIAQVTGTGLSFMASYIVPCRRCGRLMEVKCQETE